MIPLLLILWVAYNKEAEKKDEALLRHIKYSTYPGKIAKTLDEMRNLRSKEKACPVKYAV